MSALQEVGDALTAAVQETLRALEEYGMEARAADEFIRECVFNAWWDWDYGVVARAAGSGDER